MDNYQIKSVAFGGFDKQDVISYIEKSAAEAAALQQELMPLTDVLFREVNPIPVKAAMKILGYDCGNCRLPLSEPDPATVSDLTALLT